MKRTRLIIIVLIAVVLISIGIPLFVHSATTPVPSGIPTSGFIEATTVNITLETGGRIASIAAGEGDTIQAGTPLVKLDDTLLMAQKQQAEASLSLAQANQVQAGLARDNAQKAWENARDVQLGIAEVNLEEANTTFSKITYPYSFSTFAFDVPSAIASINDAQRILNETNGTSQPMLPPDQFKQAQDDLTNAQQSLNRGQGENAFAEGRLPVSDYWTLRTAQLEMNKAQLSVQNASSAVDQAYTSYQQATNGIDIAAQQEKQAQAALDVVNIQLGKLTAVSPISGTVSAKNLNAGEVASAGAPVLVVTELENVTLDAYVPESQIGLIKLGQKASVTVDSYPGQIFTGTITFISPQAIFTPGNVQLQSEREKTVFAVKITISNPDQKLKPGMPADATIISP